MNTLVSGLMPARGRRTWARQALECFLAQTHEPKELIVIDDADDPSFPDGVDHPSVKYVRNPERLWIPVKRNQAAAMAQGDILMHFDTDDWSAPERMADQVRLIEETGKPVTGYHTMLFVHGGKVLEYRGFHRYAIGTSLAFLRSWWEAHPFYEGATLSTDNRFVSVARDLDALHCTPAGTRMVARIHADNSNHKEPRPPSFNPVDRSRLPQGFPG